MQMVQLIYCSKVTTKEEEIIEVNKSILKSANLYNSHLGISGLLLFDNKYYLQVLEGLRENVNQLYSKIQKDKRHSDIQILLYRDIYKRNFEKWSMGWASSSITKNKIFFKYCGHEEFNPSDLTGSSSFELLQDFSHYICEK